jgi:Flp pilus assembly protein CpaB
VTKYRMRNIVVSVTLAAVGALLIGLYVTSYRRDVNHGAGLVPVLVAARDIPQGTTGVAVASGGYLKTSQVLRRNVVPGAIAQSSRLASLVAGAPIYQGEQVTIRQFQPVSQAGIFASFSGRQRAMIIPGDTNQLLVGAVGDGDRVDVLVNVRYKAAGEGRVAVKTILRNLLVLRAPTSPGSSAAGSSSSPAITLVLSDTQAQKLLFTIKNSDWWLVLRPKANPKSGATGVETLPRFVEADQSAQSLLQLEGPWSIHVP